jgi:ParB/RepB/Spo0J family partition protein
MIQAETSASPLAVEKLGEVVLVPRHSIRPFPDQPRKYFDQQKLAELAASIKAVGQKVPGFVKEISNNGCPQKYELIDGQRRWHALAMAGIDKMKVIVTEVKDVEEQFLISVVSNFGRAEHGPIEIANAIQRFRNNGMTVTQVAEVFARSDAWVYQHLKVLQLDPEVQKMMSPEIPEDCRLVFSVALMLADVPMDLQKKIADTIIGDKLKMVQARNLIRRRAEKMGFKVGSPDRSPRKDYQNLRSFIGRIRRELEIFEEMPQNFFDKMFQFRDDEDHAKVLASMQKSVEGAKSLLSAIKRAKKKESVTA